MTSMETYTLQKDIRWIGFQVESFPQGIPQAFDRLMKLLPDGGQRSYYGISYFDSSGQLVYVVAAEEKAGDEGVEFSFTRGTLEKGDYRAATIRSWRTRMDTIKTVFDELLKDRSIDPSKPCVEWYFAEDEMRCMVKLI